MRFADKPERKNTVPVKIRPLFKKNSGEYIHYFYFKNRNKRLDLINKSGTFTENRAEDFANYIGLKRFYSWYIEDVFAAALRVNAENYRYVQKLVGKSRLRQLLEMLFLSVYLPCKPDAYYKFEFFLKKNRKKAKYYVHRYEMKGFCYSLMNVRKSDIGTSNKYIFAGKMEELGIPVIPTYGVVASSGIIDEHFQKLCSLKEDVFIKPVSGKGGKGASLYLYDSDLNLWKKDNKLLSMMDLINKYKKKSSDKKNRYIFQKRVKNDSSMYPLTGNTASTCRVVTIINESGEPEVVSAGFRMAADRDSVVDNVHAGGFAAPVDINSGILGLACYLGESGNLSRFDSHPTTGERIVGFKLPQWKEVVDLCIKAHVIMKPKVVIGWDICITSDGPVIVEANNQPCTDGIQRREELPLGLHRLGEIIEFHLRRNPDCL